jgi:NAD-dependent deacetylase
VGTSGAVYPAASLPHEAQAAGAAVIGIDPAPVDADVWLQGAAANVLPRLVDEAFGASRA